MLPRQGHLGGICFLPIFLILPAWGKDCQNETPPKRFRVGGLSLCPSGFLDTIGAFRSATVNDSISTDFERIPLVGTPGQALGSVGHSRLMLESRLPIGSGTLKGYFESDFLNAPTKEPFRFRQYWAEYETHGWQFLAGQAWSLLRANRKGISSESDSFDTDVIDPNYHVGLLGFRKRQVRITKELRRDWRAAVSVEKGGDVGFKVAHDRLKGHFEIMGLVGRNNRRGIGVALSVPLASQLNFTTQQFITKGSGPEALRLLPPNITGYSGITGLEWQARRNLEIYSYAGLVYGERSSGNRTAREWTIGFTDKLYTDSTYGIVAISAQYSRVDRSLWTGGRGTLDYVMLSLRYSYPR